MSLRAIVFWIGGSSTVLLLAGGIYHAASRQDDVSVLATSSDPGPRLQSFGNYTLWWDDVPKEVLSHGQSTAIASNLRPQDYAGPESCRSCHKKQYQGWANHSHRWMNARVEDARVVGNFADQKISYLGGEVTFSKDEAGSSGDVKYWMRLNRGDVRREYEITQTIGSRFFQYYVGRQHVGPEPTDHPLYHEDHVLPLGYWISREEWVPVVHVHGEVPEDRRHDPFLVRNDWPREEFAEYAGSAMDLYRSQCNFCHTTFSVGDMFVRHQQLLARHLPTRFDMSLPEYVKAARPQLWPDDRPPAAVSDDEFATILKTFRNLDATENAVTLGISCEACHLGCKEHVDGAVQKPLFFPHAPEAVIASDETTHDLGRTHANINWACGRCHAGHRPQLAAGMSTWNSTEFTDAMRGACYSQLTCVTCHDPHQTLGQGWTRTPLEDDAICLSCHQQYEEPDARMAHTRHPMDSEGSRCMNCHMPRLNEGLQEVVRTHMIFSPTNAAMIEANHPNACNQCHVEQSIQWTRGYLAEWYGKTYSDRAILMNYPQPDGPAALGWLSSTNESVRLIAADCLARAGAKWAIPDLLNSLDDTYLLNRQFGQMALENLLGVNLRELGYQFYQTPSERELPIKQLRQTYLPTESAN